jgi:hypothetical protein
MRLVMQNQLIQASQTLVTFCPTTPKKSLGNQWPILQAATKTWLVWCSQEEVDQDGLVRSILPTIRHINQIHACALTPLPQLSGELDHQQQKSEDIYKR